MLNPGAYYGAAFDMFSGTDSFAFRQNTIHGGQPIAQFDSSAKACTFHGDCSIPTVCNKSSIDSVTTNVVLLMLILKQKSTVQSQI